MTAVAAFVAYGSTRDAGGYAGECAAYDAAIRDYGHERPCVELDAALDAAWEANR
jgi:hypothetical protein